MFKELDLVRIKSYRKYGSERYKVIPTDIGVVLMVFGEEAYEVEFFHKRDKTHTVLTLKKEEVDLCDSKNKSIILSGPEIMGIAHGNLRQIRKDIPSNQPESNTDFNENPKPRYKVGDIIWVKERYQEAHPCVVPESRYNITGQAGIPGPPGVTYRVIYLRDGEVAPSFSRHNLGHPYHSSQATGERFEYAHEYYWESSNNMPIHWSRMTLKVTDVKLDDRKENWEIKFDLVKSE